MLNFYKKSRENYSFFKENIFILSTEEQSEECEKCTNSGGRKIIFALMALVFFLFSPAAEELSALFVQRSHFARGPIQQVRKAKQKVQSKTSDAHKNTHVLAFMTKHFSKCFCSLVLV